MVQLLTSDPSQTAYYQTRDRDRAEALGDIGLKNAQKTAGAEDAIDQSLRDWLRQGGVPRSQTAGAANVAQPTAAPAPAATANPGGNYSDPMQGQPPAAPQQARTPQTPLGQIGAGSSGGGDRYAGLYDGLSGTPGTGRFMLGLKQQEQQRGQDLTLKMFDAMDRGDIQTAQYLSQQTGFNLPPEAWQDSRVIRTIGQAKHFVPLYAGDPQRLGQFLQHALTAADQTGGRPDWQGGLQAYPPRSKQQAAVEGLTESLGHKPDDVATETIYGAHIPRPIAPSFGTATVVDPDTNQPVVQTYDRRTGAPAQTLGGAVPRANPRETPEEKTWANAVKTATGEKDMLGNPVNKDPAAIQKRARDIYQSWATGRPTATVQAPRVDQGPATSGPAAPAAAAAQPQQGAQALPDGVPPGSTQIGTKNGNPVYQTPDGQRLMVQP